MSVDDILKRGSNFFSLYRRIIFIFCDSAILSFALLAAIWFRFENLEPLHLKNFVWIIPVTLPSIFAIFWFFGLYNRSLRYTSIPDLIAIFNAVTVVSLLKFSLMFAIQGYRETATILVLDWVLGLVLISASRITPRIILNVAEKDPFYAYFIGEPANPPKRVLIFGAGRAGESVAREIRRNEHLPYKVIGFIDDSSKKMGQYIHGFPVLGNRSTLNRVIAEEKVGEIIIAVPSASGETLREIIRLCRDSKVRFLTIPGMRSLIEGELQILQLRAISVEDLLRRPPAEINLAEIAAYITGKKILITGAGGSIGSEICRQVLPFKPAAIILLGHGENSIFTILQELMIHPELGGIKLIPVIASIKDEEKIDFVFSTHKPDIVFHAAAHKHVPLMETNPEEAVKNNIGGTYNLVKIAHAKRVERFVMVSTDKAVNPTSIMGVTKRVAEMILKAFAKKSATRFCAVRFGNVLGSRGSVIPMFKSQIERGGPVTVTHPNMIRYFMTIPEASKLVIQAGSYGKGGEVFLLDMGNPVKIIDLAEDLIRLAGLEIGKDIQIQFSGIRPGEKLYEELLTAEEGITATKNKKIYIAKPESVNREELFQQVSLLLDYAQNCNTQKIISTFAQIVTSYNPNRDQHNYEPRNEEPLAFSAKGRTHLKVI